MTTRPRASAFVAVALLSLSGCAHPQVGFVCAAHGGRPWLEARSAHFVLSTDLDEDRARSLSAELERADAAFDAFFNHPARDPAPLAVTAFRSRVDYEALVHAPSQAATVMDDDHGLSVVLTVAPKIAGAETDSDQAFSEGWVGYTSSLAIGSQAVRHELAHAYLSRAVARQPGWISEGVATYLETVEVRDGRAVYGEIPLHLAQALLVLGPMKARALFAAGYRGNDLHFYASAHLLVHLLAGTRPAAFADYLTRIARGEADAPAWNAAFPEWDRDAPGALDGLDVTLAAYRKQKSVPRHALPVDPPARTATVRRLSPAEVHAVRLALALQTADAPRRERLRAEAEEALAEAPALWPALEFRIAASPPAERGALARAAVAVAPREASAWVTLARQLHGDGEAAERDAAMERALEAGPRAPADRAWVALWLVGAGRSGEALPLVRQAVRQAPWSPRPRFAQAVVLADLGMCAEALAASRAVDPARLPDDPDWSSARLRERIAACER